MNVSNPLAKLLFSDPLGSANEPSTFLPPVSTRKIFQRDHTALNQVQPSASSLGDCERLPSSESIRCNSALRELALYCRDRHLLPGHSPQTDQTKLDTSLVTPGGAEQVGQRQTVFADKSEFQGSSSASSLVHKNVSHCYTTKENRTTTRKAYSSKTRTLGTIDEDWVPLDVEGICSSSSISSSLSGSARNGDERQKDFSTSHKREMIAWNWGDEEEPCTVTLSGMYQQHVEEKEHQSNEEKRDLLSSSSKTDFTLGAGHKLQPILQPDLSLSDQSGSSIKRRNKGDTVCDEEKKEEWDMDNEEDEEDEETLRKKLEQEVLAAGGDFYDTSADEEDEKWVCKHLRVGDKKSDAILSCPGCFTPVCYQCQRHEKNFFQYRAAAAYNIQVDLQQPIPPRPATQESSAGWKSRRQRRGELITKRVKKTTGNDSQEDLGSSSPGVHSLKYQGDSNEKDNTTATSLLSSSSSQNASEADQIEGKIRNQDFSSKTDKGSPMKNTDTAKEGNESRSLDGKKEIDAIMAKSDETAGAGAEASHLHLDCGGTSGDPTSTTEDTGRKHEDLRVLVHVERLMGSRKNSSPVVGEDVKGRRNTDVFKTQDKRSAVRRNPREKEENDQKDEEDEEESDSEDGIDGGQLAAVEGLEGVVTYRIKCANCNTVLGLQDEKDIFHFFHVLPGEA
ncbi:e2f-associated phosphoprotein [Cystoisospora suis]|uniref:E2f-associated phosphoprotein n=1 Tax=Cystoisospora suis TaxID=483139 RepID=A0A2C6KNY6_9APIC|nr:e2f-associated phosphoprotein [Cystoisospora suis]